MKNQFSPLARLGMLNFKIKALCNFTDHDQDVTLDHILKASKFVKECNLMVNGSGVIMVMDKNYSNPQFCSPWDLGRPLKDQSKEVFAVLYSVFKISNSMIICNKAKVNFYETIGTTGIHN